MKSTRTHTHSRNAASLRRAALALLVAATTLAAVTPSLARKARRADMDAAKARYYYLEASVQDAADKSAESYALYKKAYLTDTASLEAGFHLGMLSLIGGVYCDSTVMPDPGVLLRRYIDAYPADFINSYTYTQVALTEGDTDEAKRVLRRLDTIFPAKTEILIHLADLYAKTGDYDQGLQYLERYEKAESPSPQLSLYKISYLMAKGDSAGCIAEADRLYNLNPSAPQNVLFKAQIYDAFEMPDTAIVYLLRAEELAPQNGAIKSALANYYKDRGDTVAYDNKVYEALLAEDSDLDYKLKTLAEYLMKLLTDKSDTSRGDTLFKALTEQYPHDPAVLDLSARYNSSKGDYAKAADDISYAIDQEPDNQDYYLQQLSYLLMLDDTTRMQAAYDNALAHVDFTPRMAIMLSHAYFMKEDYDNGIRALEAAIKDVNPSLSVDSLCTDTRLTNSLSYEDLESTSNLFCMVGDMRQKQNDLDGAATAYENALFFMPIDPMALNNYAYMLATNGGDLDRAYDLSKRAIDLEGDNPTYLDTYAWVLYLQGHYDLAEDQQRRAISLAEADGQEVTDPDLYAHYGDILQALGIADEAVVYWKKALDLDPENKELQQKLKKK